MAGFERQVGEDTGRVGHDEGHRDDERAERSGETAGERVMSAPGLGYDPRGQRCDDDKASVVLGRSRDARHCRGRE